MSGIEGKVVAITGAGSGIGEATALLLAERGAKVVLGARRTGRLEDLAGRIEKSGGQVAWIRTDVTVRQDLASLVELARGRFGRLDALVSNAGIGPISPLDDLRVEDWENMIDVNFKGVLYGVAAALPVFREQGSGHFVNVVSTAGLRIVPTQAVYAATSSASAAEPSISYATVKSRLRWATNVSVARSTASSSLMPGSSPPRPALI